MCVTLGALSPIHPQYKATRAKTSTPQPRFELIRDSDNTPAKYSERIRQSDTRKEQFSFAIEKYQPSREQFIITRPAPDQKDKQTKHKSSSIDKVPNLDDSTKVKNNINDAVKFPNSNEGIFSENTEYVKNVNPSITNDPHNKSDEEEFTASNEKLELRTGSMVCCSCTRRYEDCPNQSNDFVINPRIGTVSNNQSINLHNITKRDAPFDKLTTSKEEEPVQWESDGSLNTHCPPSQPFPCFCYSTNLEDAKQPQNLKSPALDVHLSFDQNTQEFDVHRVHITKPSFGN